MLSIRKHFSLHARKCFLLQVDFQDFRSVKEWRSPAVNSKSTVLHTLIDDKWKDTVTLAHRALKLWGETSVVPVSTTGLLEEDEILSGDDVPPPPPNSPPNETQQVHLCLYHRPCKIVYSNVLRSITDVFVFHSSQSSGKERVDRLVNVFADAMNEVKRIASERDSSVEDAAALESSVRELSANKIVLETKLYDTEQRENGLQTRLTGLERDVETLQDNLRAAEASSRERSTIIDRLRNLIDPLRRAVTEMGM